MDVSVRPRALIAATRGGEGKTLLSTGLLAAWREDGHRVAPFKKGPDYIDAAWLSEAAGAPCRNLDLFLMPPDTVSRSFAASASSEEIAFIEGNRGLYDGMDTQGTYSTAELAKLLKTPVILIVDGTKSTRTVAATILGCQHLDPEVPLRGVILNRVTGKRHATVIRDSVERICKIPVLGTIPRMAHGPFVDRHLGLVPPPEHRGRTEAIREAAQMVRRFLDVESILQIAHSAPALAPTWKRAVSLSNDEREGSGTKESPPIRMGVCHDAAFSFYYPENLESLEQLGARIVYVAPLTDRILPSVDALYIGGGFPETHAAALANNKSFRASLKTAIDRGLPVYAECGGTMYLCEDFLVHGSTYPMVGALPVRFAFGAKPQGHGYTALKTVTPNPFFAVGESFRGHEFHYMFAQNLNKDLKYAFQVDRGHGFDGEHDGLCYRNVLASLTHVHALGVPSWARAMVKRAREFRDETLQAERRGEVFPCLPAAGLIG